MPDRSMFSDAGWQLNEADRPSVALLGSQGSQITAEENPVLVRRRIMHSSQAAARGSNLIIRLHSALNRRYPRVYRRTRIIDDFSPACLAIRVKRKLNLTDVIDALTDLFAIRGVPALHPLRVMVRSYLRCWIKTASMWRLRITSPWHLEKTVIAKASMPVPRTK